MSDNTNESATRFEESMASERDSVTAPLWKRVIVFAGLIVLGIAPYAQAQLDPPNTPAFCPPLTSIAHPTLFDVFWGTTPIRFPY